MDGLFGVNFEHIALSLRYGKTDGNVALGWIVTIKSTHGPWTGQLTDDPALARGMIPLNKPASPVCDVCNYEQWDMPSYSKVQFGKLINSSLFI